MKRHKFQVVRAEDSEADNSTGVSTDQNELLGETTRCEPCNNTFSSPQALKQHVKEIHTRVEKRNGWICDICGKGYATNFTLKRHRRTNHKSVPEVISPKPITCSVCLARFTAKKGLVRHLSVIHGIITPKRRLLNPPDSKYMCYHCEKKFTTMHTLKRHMIRLHNVVSANFSGKFICPLCKNNFSSAKLLDDHLSSEHRIHQVEEHLTFDTREDFFAWKAEIERSTFTRYSQSSGKRRLLYGQRIYYNCNRSGIALSKGNGIRLAQRESIKMNATCPSRMVATFIRDEPISVKFSTVHVGHDSELCTSVRLQHDGESLAPQEELMDEHDYMSDASSCSPDDTGVINVIEEFEMDREGADSDEPDDSSNELNEYNSVVYYKAENTEGDGLRKEDYLIVVMTKDQEEVFINYTDGRIVVDCSCGSVDVFVITLLTLDERSTGCPMAFCVSNRNDELAMRIFFEVVKSRVGAVQTNIFMFDGDPYVYNAWKEVMSPSKHLLLSSWHVDADWRKKCQATTPNVVKAAELYKGCRVLLETTEVDDFDILLERFIDKCAKDPETQTFKSYFVRNYSNCGEQWALSHRIRLGLSTNMHLEALFKKLRYCYPDGKKYRTVDTIIDELNDLSKDVIFERMVCHTKKRSNRDVISERHEKSDEISNSMIEILSPCEWEVHSSLLKEPYKVVVDSEGSCENCDFICSACDICLHRVTCTCNDYLLDSAFCEHIHACLQLKKSQSKIENEDLVDKTIPLDETQAAQTKFQDTVNQLQQLIARVPSKCLKEACANVEQLTNFMQTLVSLPEQS